MIRYTAPVPKLWPRSLIARILLVELCAILIAAVALPAATVWLLNKQVRHYQHQMLKEQANLIAEGLDVDDGEVTVDPVLRRTYASPYDGRAFVIADRAGRMVTSSAFATLVPWQHTPREGRRRYFRIGQFVGVSVPVGTGADEMWVIVTQDEAGEGAIVDDIVRAFLWRYGPLLFAVLLLLPLVNSLLIRQLVNQVRKVSAQAGAIGPHSLDIRLEEGALPTEVAPLAHATNALVVRLGESFEQQSQFAANVAHELRTPLTTLNFELEAVADDDLRLQLGRSVDRLSHVIAQLQALASLERAAQVFTRFDVAEVAREVIAELAPRILGAGDMIALEAGEAAMPVTGNRLLIALALSNLVTNATRHTPAGTSILVRLAGPDRIEVLDDGPGIAAPDPELSKQRYWRADMGRADGAGLGLSIVARIMEVHEGALEVANRAEGGAVVTLRFGAI